MDPSPQLDLGAPAAAATGRRSLRKSVGQFLRRLAERTVLWLHRQADRFDLIPSEFGKDADVDAADAGSLAREWWRQARLWAAYNPEEMFAIKVGGTALGLALLALIILVRALH